MKNLLSKNPLPLVLLLLCSIILYRLPLNASLWLDESMTWWAIKSDWNTAIQRSLSHQGQPLIFVTLEWLWRHLGESELWLRLPSLICVFASAWFIYSLSLKLIDRNTALLATIFFLSSSQAQVAAASVRPYGFALSACMAGLWALTIWATERRLSLILISALLLALSAQAHLVFAGSALLAILLIGRVAQDTPNRIRSIATWLIVFLIASVPALLEYAHWPNLGQIFANSAHPSAQAISKLFIDTHLLVGLACGLVCGFIFKPYKFNFEKFRRDSLLFTVWTLVPPLLLITLSLLGGYGFYQRWILWGLPGTCLAWSILIQAIDNESSRRACIVVFSLLMLGFEINRSWQTEDWRGAIAVINKEQQTKQYPVLLYSGLAETGIAAWFLDSGSQDFYKAPLSYYSVNSPVYPVPKSPNADDSVKYLNGVWPQVESGFIFLAPNQGVANQKINQKYDDVFLEHGWKLSELNGAGSVRAVKVGP